MRFFLASLALVPSSSSPSATAFVVPSSSSTTAAAAKTATTSLDASKCGNYDYDVIIIGCGVGGQGAALHSRSQELSTAIFSSNDVGGTCVNCGCVPSKALLAASGRRVREMRATEHLGEFGIKDIILAPGSIPFVPPGVTVDEKTVYTSDGALELQSVPQWVAIIGSGYIVLEFSDVYTALSSEVTFIEALPNIMPTFDREIAKQAERLLIRDRPIDYRTGVFASEVTPGIPGVKPVTIKMIDAKTKEHVETLEVDAAMVATGCVPNTANMGLESAGIETSRGFVAVNPQMRVMTKHGDEGVVIPNLYCIGDANGKMMLVHAASAQGISAIENICGRSHTVNHDAIPAACFTHPEIAIVGPTEEQAIERAAKEGWTLGKSQGSFRANSKALAELEGNGMAKVLYNKESGKVVVVDIIGFHTTDLIQECANAVAAGTTVQELSMMVHTHPTLCEVLDEAFKGAVGMSAH
ncbi:hypothetical protein ACHAXA_001923 [Cyclostephanos tholiformis]|uniref:Dihydrolipoyl dehydrogenase n=1 Tax=Cyclostephanos tholiformis TaxID=382380 RepID=A0ABD3R994_9STRA